MKLQRLAHRQAQSGLSLMVSSIGTGFGHQPPFPHQMLSPTDNFLHRKNQFNTKYSYGVYKPHLRAWSVFSSRWPTKSLQNFGSLLLLIKLFPEKVFSLYALFPEFVSLWVFCVGEFFCHYIYVSIHASCAFSLFLFSFHLFHTIQFICFYFIFLLIYYFFQLPVYFLIRQSKKGYGFHWVWRQGGFGRNCGETVIIVHHLTKINF